MKKSLKDDGGTALKVEEGSEGEKPGEIVEDFLPEEEKKPEVKIVKGKSFLRYDYTKEERAELADQLANATIELTHAETRKKGIVKELDVDISKIETTIQSLAQKVKDGYEHRDVPVEYIFDYEKRVKHMIRQDSLALVKDIPLTAEELQVTLPLEK